MILSSEMTHALDRRIKSKVTNVPVLEMPVLILFDYSPFGSGHNAHSLSIAFDCAGRARCWLTETQLEQIDGDGPKYHPKYKQFAFEGRQFHPFSVQPFPSAIFSDIDALFVACQSLYNHINWS